MIPMIFGVVALCLFAHTSHHQKQHESKTVIRDAVTGGIKTEPCPKESVRYADDGRVKRDSNGDRVG